jgi:hypothetical protein
MMGRYNNQGSKKQIGHGLSLEKFADAKISKYDKKKVLAKRGEEKLRRHAQYKKLKSKLKSAGRLLSPTFLTDNGVILQFYCMLMLCCPEVNASIILPSYSLLFMQLHRLRKM